MKWLVRHWLGLERDALTDVQYARLKQRIGERSRHDHWANLLYLVPGLVALMMIPFWLNLAGRFSIVWRAASEAAFALCVLPYVYWLLRRRFTRHGWRVLRELGYADVCGRCGYNLSRHPQATGVCPECGEPFSQFQPDRTWSTDQS